MNIGCGSLRSKSHFSAEQESFPITFFLFQAVTVRNSMAKSLYSALFDWIVFRINHALLNSKDMEESTKVTPKQLSWILSWVFKIDNWVIKHYPGVLLNMKLIFPRIIAEYIIILSGACWAEKDEAP